MARVQVRQVARAGTGFPQGWTSFGTDLAAPIPKTPGTPLRRSKHTGKLLLREVAISASWVGSMARAASWPFSERRAVPIGNADQSGSPVLTLAATSVMAEVIDQTAAPLAKMRSQPPCSDLPLVAAGACAVDHGRS